MEFVDTHCHLHFKDYFSDPEQVLADAKKRGVSRVINVGTSLQDSRKAIDLAESNDSVWATAGVHPHDASDFLAMQESSILLETLLNRPKVIAVGEIGLDYYRNRSPKNIQEKALRAQIEIGQKMNLPFVFHIRDTLPTGRQAWNDFWRIIDDYADIRGVAHSFNSGLADLDKILSRGLYVALNGIMTFTGDESQLAAAKAVPLNRLVIETDAPFLAPTPFRGKTCEPKHVTVIAKFLADLRGEALEELAKTTTRNAIELFGLK